MARPNALNSFEMLYETRIETLVRGHHVYKTIWTGVIGEKLFTSPDSREEAKAYDKHAIGISKDSGFTELVGHSPIEISTIIYYFLRADERNRVNVQVTGKRKREVGLVVPARYHMYIRCARVLNTELEKIKTIYPTLELKYDPKTEFYKTPLFTAV